MAKKDIVGLLGDALQRGDIRHAKEAGTFPPYGEDFDFLVFALARCRDNAAQLAQDLWVLHQLDDKRDGYFVEFGVGDGAILSNTAILESRYGWRGVLAEPNPAFHMALRRNRRARISTKCIAGVTGATVMFNCTDNPHLSTIDAYSEADDHAAARASGARIPVQTQTLSDLLREAVAPRQIDYVSIDTEGSEYDILAAFDFDEYDIALMSVEHNWTEREPQLDELLARNGFERRFRELTDFDAWYVNPNHLARAKAHTSGLIP